MKKVVLNLKNRSVMNKVEMGRQVAAAIDGNADFPNPLPTVAATNSASDELETAYNEAELARQAAKEKTALLKQKEAAFDKNMNKVGNYVENTADGDETKILGAGLQVKAKAVRHQDRLPKPEHLKASNSEMPNEIILQWDKVVGAKNYHIEICLDPMEENTWVHTRYSTRLKAAVGGLVSGQRYWFRVSAINSRGEGAWSEAVSRMAM
jgi:hypothetical protein